MTRRSLDGSYPASPDPIADSRACVEREAIGHAGDVIRDAAPGRVCGDHEVALNLVRIDDTGTKRVPDVVVDIGDGVRHLHDLTLQGGRRAPGFSEDVLTYF